IAESLRRRIAAGELHAGDKLPPVRQMAGQWNCTPGTVSRAYAILAQEGLVAGQRGSGTHVLPNTLQPEQPVWHWAALVNRAEQYLLEVINKGHSPLHAEAALRLAISRWQELQSQGSPPDDRETAVSHRLRFAGSHDLAIGFLTRMLAEADPELDLETSFVGSLGGLMALAQGGTDTAGIHLWDEATDSYNLPYVHRLLPGRRAVLVALANRSLGLMTVPDNPYQIQTLADLIRPGVRLVNRQSGSGTRVWLDARFKALAIDPQMLPGYGREETTHMAVAQAIRQGKADVGLGIYAAAAAYGLHFIPLTQERYDLVFLESVWQTPAAQALVAVVRSHAFKEAVAALGGYDTAVTGQEIWSDS
ncbi:MAG: GntR family transcriptional regulator, partial [Ardenticatenaceae bacterium]|nr:GntR family transcriptional regulator [Ardenticatenaceae bacterium]